MNVKIQSKGIAGGHNTGSCLGYANYLEPLVSGKNL